MGRATAARTKTASGKWFKWVAAPAVIALAAAGGCNENKQQPKQQAVQQWNAARGHTSDGLRPFFILLTTYDPRERLYVQT